MCIRDSIKDIVPAQITVSGIQRVLQLLLAERVSIRDLSTICLLYTSDAADERSSVDLGGRRIIKKKTKHVDNIRHTPTK